MNVVDSGSLPLVVTPSETSSAPALAEWIAASRALREPRGAVLFRGFDVGAPEQLELVARAIDPELKNDYLGTSPRDALTTPVFSASELPPYYPIPQHCEMSFLRSPPRRLMFCCLVPSQGIRGETPLADFRAVYRDPAGGQGARLHLRRRLAHPRRRHGAGARRHLEEPGRLPLGEGRRPGHRQLRRLPRPHAVPGPRRIAVAWA